MGLCSHKVLYNKIASKDGELLIKPKNIQKFLTKEEQDFIKSFSNGNFIENLSKFAKTSTFLYDKRYRVKNSDFYYVKEYKRPVLDIDNLSFSSIYRFRNKNCRFHYHCKKCNTDVYARYSVLSNFQDGLCKKCRKQSSKALCKKIVQDFDDNKNWKFCDKNHINKKNRSYLFINHICNFENFESKYLVIKTIGTITYVFRHKKFFNINYIDNNYFNEVMNTYISNRESLDKMVETFELHKK